MASSSSVDAGVPAAVVAAGAAAAAAAGSSVPGDDYDALQLLTNTQAAKQLGASGELNDITYGICWLFWQCCRLIRLSHMFACAS
jgi:3-oxoacyl-ACP reductase-like protein